MWNCTCHFYIVSAEPEAISRPLPGASFRIGGVFKKFYDNLIGISLILLEAVLSVAGSLPLLGMVFLQAIAAGVRLEQLDRGFSWF